MCDWGERVRKRKTSKTKSKENDQLVDKSSIYNHLDLRSFPQIHVLGLLQVWHP